MRFLKITVVRFQNYISYLIDLQEQFNPGLDMIGFVPYLVDTD
ncbi:hypothetical protein OKM_02705, partial [Enterococcus faecium EnGen0041]